MAVIDLKLKKNLEFPLEAESISPNMFAGKKAADIKKLPVFHGNEQRKLEIFLMFLVMGEILMI